MMDAETWLNASDAVDMGFATAIAEDATEIAAAAFDPKRYRNTPDRFANQSKPDKPATAWKRESAARKLRMLGGR